MVKLQRNTFAPVSTSEAICVLSSTNNWSSCNSIHGVEEQEQEQHQQRQNSKSVRVLAVAIVFCAVMMIVEGVGGVVAHSLAVLSDAVHMLADVFALSISLFAAYSTQWEGNHLYSFGWRRAEVIGALVSVITTWGLVVWISLSALERTYTIVRCARMSSDDQLLNSSDGECESLSTPLMIILGLFGFAMNIVLAVILHCGNVHAHSHGGLRTCDLHDEEDGNNNNNNNNNNNKNNNHFLHDCNEFLYEIRPKNNNNIKPDDLHSHHSHSERCHTKHTHRHMWDEMEMRCFQNEPGKHNHTLGFNERIDDDDNNNKDINKNNNHNCNNSNNSFSELTSKLEVTNTLTLEKSREVTECAPEYEEGNRHQALFCYTDVAKSAEHVNGICIEDDMDAEDSDNVDTHNHTHDCYYSHTNNNNNHHHEHEHEHSHGDNTHSMNVRAALIHVLGDCLQAVGVVLAAVVMYCGNSFTYHISSSAHSYYNLADPLLSLLFGVITIFTTKRLIRDVLEVLMERVPDENMYDRVVEMMYSVEYVDKLQDVHIWTIGPGLIMLCATIIVTTSLSAHKAQELLDVLTSKCKNMGIHHNTIQINYHLTRSDA